jgi:hypothetical protein
VDHKRAGRFDGRRLDHTSPATLSQLKRIRGRAMLENNNTFRLMVQLTSCATSAPRDLLMQAMILREARRRGDYRWALSEILAKRATYKLDIQRRQSDWATKVSRRPQRNHHYDSWAAREKYVRCTASNFTAPRYLPPNLALHPNLPPTHPLRGNRYIHTSMTTINTEAHSATEEGALDGYTAYCGDCPFTGSSSLGAQEATQLAVDHINYMIRHNQ